MDKVLKEFSNNGKIQYLVDVKENLGSYEINNQLIANYTNYAFWLYVANKKVFKLSLTVSWLISTSVY